MDDIQLNGLQESLYQSIGGEDIGTRKEFYDELLNSDSFRRKLHEKAGGRKIGTYGEFIDELGFKIKETPTKGGKTELEKLYENPGGLLDEPKETPYQYTLEERKQEAFRKSQIQKANALVEKKLAGYKAQSGAYNHSSAYIGGEVPIYTEGMGQPNKKFDEGKWRQAATDETLRAMPEFLSIATPDDIEEVKYGTNYVQKQKNLQRVLAKKAIDNKKEYDEILGRPDLIFSDKINAVEQSAKNTLLKIVSLVGSSGTYLDAQDVQEMALQDKQRASTYERYMLDHEATKIQDYLEIVSSELKNREKELDKHLKERGTSLKDLNDIGGKYENEQQLTPEEIERYQNGVNFLQSSPYYSEYTKMAGKYNGVYQEFEQLPIIYKQGALIKKLEEKIQAKFDKDYTDMSGALEAVSFTNETLLGGIERNFVGSVAKGIVGLGALAGIDAAEAKAMELAYQDGTYGRKASRFARPTHEKVAEVIFRKERYEIGFNENGQVSGIYNKNGDKVTFSDEDKEKLNNAIESQDIYNKAKWEMHWNSLASQGLDTMVDVAALFVGAGAVSKGIGLTGKGATNLGLTAAGKAITGASKNARLLEFTSMFGQFYGEGVMNGIRNGYLTPQDAAIMSLVTTAAEAASEALPFPMIGKLVTGGKRAADKLIAGIAQDNLLATVGKLPTMYARRMAVGTLLTSLLYETGEEFAMEYATPALNTAANDLLNGRYDDTDLPTLRDLRDLAIITSIATILPATFGALQTHDYLRSDEFIQHSLYKVLDPKNLNLVDAFLSDMAGSNKLTQEEIGTFNELRNALKSDYNAIAAQGANTAEANKLREEIIAGKAYIYKEKQNLGSDELVNKPIQEKINKAQLLTDGLIKKLQNTSSAGQQSSEEFATDNRTEGGKGEITPTFYVQEVRDVDTGESRFEINDSTTDRQSTEFKDTFKTKEAADLFLEKINKQNANKKQSTAQMDVGEQPTDGKAMGERNAQEQEVSKQGTEAQETLTAPKTNSLNLDLAKLPTDRAGRLESIKSKLQTDGVLQFIDDQGNPC